VKASRFLPGEKDGKQVKSKVLFKIPFMLNGKILYATSSPKSTQKKNEVADVTNVDSQLVDAKVEKLVDNQTDKATINVTPKNFDCDLDICAKPKEGIKGILDNFVMPAMVKRKGLEGEVVVEAVVDIYGNVRDTKVIQELGYGCDIAVEVAVLQTKFEPGISDGKPVRSNVKIRVPIVQKKEKN